MAKKRKFGLIGKNISYSFSKKFFEDKFRRLKLSDSVYDLFDLADISEVEKLFNNPEIVGLNVTIPYKEKIIGHLDELSEEASAIGAVNCIRFLEGKKIGYNTDAFGFEKTLVAERKERHKSALVLGNGGAAKAVKFVLEKHQIPYRTVARNTALNFENLTPELVSENLIIVQCTPLGTFPEVHLFPQFPFQSLTEKHLVIDLIYNPLQTSFLKKSAEMGAETVNGLHMLEQQAEKAWEIWNS